MALLACCPGSPFWSFPSWIQSRCWVPPVLDLVASPVQPAQQVQSVARQQQGKQRQQHLQSAQQEEKRGALADIQFILIQETLDGSGTQEMNKEAVLHATFVVGWKLM
ncbi:unnamed protein product [Urochloa humidicola]